MKIKNIRCSNCGSSLFGGYEEITKTFIALPCECQKKDYIPSCSCEILYKKKDGERLHFYVVADFEKYLKAENDFRENKEWKSWESVRQEARERVCGEIIDRFTEIADKCGSYKEMRLKNIIQEIKDVREKNEN
jgi:hypothetical protein